MRIKNTIAGTAIPGTDPGTGKPVVARRGQVVEVDDAVAGRYLADGHEPADETDVAPETVDDARAALEADDYHAMRSAAGALGLEATGTKAEIRDRLAEALDQ